MSLEENRPADDGWEDEQHTGRGEASSDHSPHGDRASSSSMRVDPVQESAPSPTRRTYSAPKGKRFSNKADREILLSVWVVSVTSEDKMVSDQSYDERERKDFFAAWLRQLIADGELDPRRRLPPYDVLTGPPFYLSKKAIGKVINELRAEGLFPKRKKRKDADQQQWRARDTSCFLWIGEMRAIRSDQLRRLLARWSPGEPRESGQLSMTRTSQIIDRWVKAGYVVYRKIYVKQPGWVYLTRKGMQAANLPYRATPPADTMLTHIYSINEVRLAFEEESEENMQWISERAILAEQEQIRKGDSHLEIIPDGTLVILNQTDQRTGNPMRIDIEVQLADKDTADFVRIMRGGTYGHSSNALCYYVSPRAKNSVMRAYKQVRAEEQRNPGYTPRPYVRVNDLESLSHKSR